MKPDIKINNVSMLSLGWLRESIDFPTPKSQSETITVPGRNSPIRFTEALGRISYEPRTFTIVLTMLGDRKKYNRMVEELSNNYSGHLCRVILSEEPEFYYVGTLELEDSYDPLTGKGIATLSCSDADSYKYHLQETVKHQSGSGTITIVNDFLPVVPVMTTSAQTTLTWQVGTDQFTKTLSAGTWEIPELELAPGENRIKISGSGTTTFTFREGRL